MAVQLLFHMVIVRTLAVRATGTFSDQLRIEFAGFLPPPKPPPQICGSGIFLVIFFSIFFYYSEFLKGKSSLRNHMVSVLNCEINVWNDMYVSRLYMSLHS